MVKQLAVVALVASAVAAAGWSLQREAPRAVRVGVTSGPHAQILEVVAQVAARRGVKVEVVEFSDYVQPNAALADGSLDANSFQHRPYLERQASDRGYRFAVLGPTVTFPMAVYSVRHRSVEALPRGAVAAIPNDPTNGARALKLLESLGLVTLPRDAGLDVSGLEVLATRDGLKLEELDAAQLPRALEDVDLAVINTNYALEAGLDPFSGLARESATSPYANVLVTREGEQGRPELLALLDAYHSDEVRDFVARTFHGAVVVAW